MISQDLANLAYALALMRHHDPAFFGELLSVIVAPAHLKHFTHQELANVRSEARTQPHTRAHT
jgi:hypothetical protein